MIVRKELVFQTERGPYLLDITADIAAEIATYSSTIGMVNLFLTGTTASLFINENESGLLQDIVNFFGDLIKQGKWKHDWSSGEGNAHAHLRNIVSNPELTIPFKKGKLLLGTWQRIFLAEWDIRPRKRQVILTIIYEEENG
jgi:secondary thiamine-phosphate synthase enzyme